MVAKSLGRDLMIGDRSKFTRYSPAFDNYYCDTLSGSVIKPFLLHDRPRVFHLL